MGPWDLEISEPEYTYTKDVVVPLGCAWHERLLAFPPHGMACKFDDNGVKPVTPWEIGVQHLNASRDILL